MGKKIITYHFKLKPTKAQQTQLSQWLGTCRYIYNYALERKINHYKETGNNLPKTLLQKEVKQLANDHDWIGAVQSQVRQDPLVRLEISYKNFFRGAGFPKWAKRHKYDSFKFPQNVKMKDGKFILPVFGKVGFYSGKRDIKKINEIKQATIKRQIDGWFISITLEIDITPKIHSENQTGIDMGVANLYATSDGFLCNNPAFYKEYSGKLRIEQRSLARKVKFSGNWKKQKMKIAKLHQKIARKRKDYFHKQTTELSNRYSFISVENLKVKNMSASAKGTLEEPGKNVKAKSGLNRSILDASPGMFLALLEYKCGWYGVEYVEVDPKYTSRICPKCGKKEPGNRKKEKFVCVECGYKDHADVNAAKNILARAMANVRERDAAA